MLILVFSFVNSSERKKGIFDNSPGEIIEPSEGNVIAL